jgi:L-ascorbate metabolism protein UlaG (beta-lactamase superfamily)
VDIRFLGHACFELTEGDTRVLFDPFLTGNPKAPVEASEVEPTHIFLTHGHADHYGDIEEIAKRTGAQVVAIVEIARELEAAGVQNVSDPNLGGTAEFDGLWVRLVPAWHTSTTPKGTSNTPAGMVVGLGGKTVYHLGDTALFSDLRLVGEREPIDVALMCIGGHYTMDRHDAAAAAGLVRATRVIPCHYDTVPPIETDAAAF